MCAWDERADSLSKKNEIAEILENVILEKCNHIQNIARLHINTETDVCSDAHKCKEALCLLGKLC